MAIIGCFENEDLPKRRPKMGLRNYENEDPLTTKTKTHYENEDPSLFSYYENEDHKIFINLYVIFVKISVRGQPFNF